MGRIRIQEFLQNVYMRIVTFRGRECNLNKNTNLRNAISSRNRLAITLRFIALGDSFRSLEFLTLISRKTIAKFVQGVLMAIYNSLQPKYMKIPQSKQEWLNIQKVS